MGKSLDLSGLAVLLGLLVSSLTLLELLASEDLTFTVIADLNELAGQLLILQIEKIFRGHHRVKVLLVVLELNKSVVVELSFHIIVDHFDSNSAVLN